VSGKETQQQRFDRETREWDEVRNGHGPAQHVAPPSLPLLAQVMAYVRRFVVVTDEQLLVAALWTVHTHCLDAAPQTPYLLITSPEKACGKSRLIEVLALLVAKPWIVVTPSEAVLYRTVDATRPTLLLDEVDALFAPGRSSDRYEGIRALLNAGHRQGTTVPRCVGPTNSVVEFKVFCAKLIAGIGTLPDTVAHRGIPVRLQRKTRAEHTDRFIHRDEQPVASALRDQIAAWADEHTPKLMNARPDMPDELDDRMQEGCEPLVAIADRMGYGAAARDALVALCTSERVDNVESQRLQLLRDIRTLFEEREAHAGGKRIKGMATKNLLSRLHSTEDSQWKDYYGRGLSSRDLSTLLRHYGVHPAPIRFKKKSTGGTQVKKGYKRGDLAQAWERYL
jgi:hypothetical protein